MVVTSEHALPHMAEGQLIRVITTAESIAAAALVAGSNVRVSIKVGLVEVDVHGDR